MLQKKHAMFQTGSAIAVNSFVAVIILAVDRGGYLFFLLTERDIFLFFLSVSTVFVYLFIYFFFFNYTSQKKEKGQILNYVLSQAKLSVRSSLKVKVIDGAEISPTTSCKRLIHSRLLIDFTFYKR